jgi:hypothetical protein
MVSLNRPPLVSLGRPAVANFTGACRPVLSKMMGHQQEATTEYYYKIHLREVIEGTRSVNFEQYGI